MSQIGNEPQKKKKMEDIRIEIGDIASNAIASEEDKIWDKAWRAQQAHVHGPIKGQAHSLCGAPDRTRA